MLFLKASILMMGLFSAVCLSGQDTTNRGLATRFEGEQKINVLWGDTKIMGLSVAHSSDEPTYWGDFYKKDGVITIPGWNVVSFSFDKAWRLVTLSGSIGTAYGVEKRAVAALLSPDGKLEMRISLLQAEPDRHILTSQMDGAYRLWYISNYNYDRRKIFFLVETVGDRHPEALLVQLCDETFSSLEAPDCGKRLNFCCGGTKYVMKDCSGDSGK